MEFSRIHSQRTLFKFLTLAHFRVDSHFSVGMSLFLIIPKSFNSEPQDPPPHVLRDIMSARSHNTSYSDDVCNGDFNSDSSSEISCVK